MPSDRKSRAGAIDHHAALIYTMVLVSAADRDMTDRELATIGDVVSHWPVFRDFDSENLSGTAEDCANMLRDEDGLDRVIESIKAALPKHLCETAYALACDVAAADGRASQEELRLLEMLRYGLEIGRLEAAAIERATRARHATF
jgi:tellurite resistance protein